MAITNSNIKPEIMVLGQIFQVIADMKKRGLNHYRPESKFVKEIIIDEEGNIFLQFVDNDMAVLPNFDNIICDDVVSDAS